MKYINIRDLFPFYERNCFIRVPADQYNAFVFSFTKEVADVYIEFEKREDAWERKRSRHSAFYSLDYGDGIEKDALYPVQSPEMIYEQNLSNKLLYNALMSLPKVQGRRIYAHFFLGLSKVKIAEIEGVAQRTVGQSIDRALKNLKKILKDFD